MEGYDLRNLEVLLVQGRLIQNSNMAEQKGHKRCHKVARFRNRAAKRGSRAKSAFFKGRNSLSNTMGQERLKNKAGRGVSAQTGLPIGSHRRTLEGQREAFRI